MVCAGLLDQTFEKPMVIYIASPLGFSEAGRYFYERSLLPTLSAAGHAILDPWALTSPAEFDRAAKLADPQERRRALALVNERAAAANAAAIRRSAEAWLVPKRSAISTPATPQAALARVKTSAR